MRPVRRVARTRALVAVLAAPLVLAVAGCGAEPTSTAPAVTTPVVRPPAELVARVGVTNADLAGDRHVRLYKQGDVVDGQVTLDYCGYDFTTEQHRVARRQVAVLPTSRTISLSNEVVAYDTPSRAAEALNELRMSVTTCPHRFVQMSLADVPELRYEHNRLGRRAALPVADNAVASAQIRAPGSAQRYYSLNVFQRQGTVLSAVYLFSTHRPTRAERKTLWKLATTTGTRLAEL